MRLAALVGSADHVCARYRLRAYEPFLREAGHSLELHPLPRGWWGRIGLARSLRDADAVILQRRLLSRPELAMMRRSMRRLWFDLDDAVWMRDSYAGKSFASRRRYGRFRTTVRSAEAVIAGNDYLSENAKLAGAPVADVIPTCLDVRRYSPAAHERLEPELVWIGSSSTLRGLSAISFILSDIGKNVPGVRLKVICDRFIHPPSMPVVEVPWSEATEASAIASADIGISWIPDDPWSRGKCGLKVLQYMAAGLPVVTNPVGVHSEIIRHGESGFLVNSTSEWIDAIRLLARDPDLRQRMGAAGRRIVQERYSVEAGAKLWLKLINSLSAA